MPKMPAVAQTAISANSKTNAAMTGTTLPVLSVSDPCMVWPPSHPDLPMDSHKQVAGQSKRTAALEQPPRPTRQAPAREMPPPPHV